MKDWPDEKIRNGAVRLIEKHSMAAASWRFTLVGSAHDVIMRRVSTQTGELPVVSCSLSEGSWYLFTTRRILGSRVGEDVEASPTDLAEVHFGNFKGYGGRETEVMTLKFSHGTEATLEYETGRASMAPIYYVKFWKRTFPVLDKLVS